MSDTSRQRLWRTSLKGLIMVAINSLLFLLTLGAGAVASAANPSLVCATDLGTKSVKSIPTTTSTTVKKVTIIKKVIRKVNIIVVPIAKTTTVFTTQFVTVTTTANPDTKTATSTIISKSTLESTRIATATTTSTSTTTSTRFITSTVAEPAGFTAILDDPLYVAKRDAKKVGKLEMLSAQASSLYPQRVSCVREVPSYSTKIVSTTVQGGRTTLKAATKTKASTVTTTITSVEYPDDVSTTVTTTVSDTVTDYTDFTTTISLTQTVTIENQVPQSTIYDACRSENILVSANGGGRVVAWVDVTSDTIPTIFGDGYTPAACCAECVKRSNCRIGILGKLSGYDFTTSTTCAVFLASDTSKCADGQQPLFARYVTTNNSPLQPQYIYSNGPCGQLKNGGDLSNY
ncbi:uncharacterized protein FMAN_14191 [Fusarium mangiferae]|uniref:Apple domain-containing protein n=1 Tax=Fusarium mangiferae TaxID=192010 RepID=A0A1L7UJB7_FUSMA|nr:uncharacterized protein FMAN_14191 [Fusarium mangiferae]CVL08145.1 uncharacterized protein FMAN_14191 [Fusarium mangiferae]